MSVGKLIDFFSTFTKLPIYAEDVRDPIVGLGLQDDVLFIKMDCPPEDLLGMFVRFRHRAALYDNGPQNWSWVLYNGKVDPNLQNLICCKELMHVFDGRIEAATSSASDFYTLLDDLFRAASPLSLSPGGLMDEFALSMALAVMFPHEIREDFIAAYAADKMSISDIARETGLPEACIPRLLSKEWEALRSVIIRM